MMTTGRFFVVRRLSWNDARTIWPKRKRDVRTASSLRDNSQRHGYRSTRAARAAWVARSRSRYVAILAEISFRPGKREASTLNSSSSVPSQRPRPESHGHTCRHECSDQASNSRIVIGTINRKQENTHIPHGVEQRRGKYALAGVVVDPHQKNPQRHGEQTLPGDPSCRSVSLQKGHDVPPGPHQAHENGSRSAHPIGLASRRSRTPTNPAPRPERRRKMQRT